MIAGATLRCLGLHVYLGRVGGHPGPRHLLRHRVADQQRRDYLQVRRIVINILLPLNSTRMELLDAVCVILTYFSR